MATATIYIDNTNNVLLTGLKAELAAVFINNAIVTLTLKNSAGVEVPGVIWPVTMEYVAASDGIYRADLTKDLDLSAGTYTAFIDADGSTTDEERWGHWELPVKAAIRKT